MAHERMWNEIWGAAIPSFHPLFSWIRAHFNFCAASLINIFSLNIGPQEGNTESERKRKGRKKEREGIFCWSREKKLLRNKKRRKSSQDKEKEREGRKRGGNEDFHSFTHPSIHSTSSLSHFVVQTFPPLSSKLSGG